MPCLVRKIAAPKWKPIDSCADDLIPADAISDLRTSGNALSFWHVDDTSESAINEAILAICAGLGTLETIDIAIIDQCSLPSVSFEHTEGATAAIALRNAHRDAVNLTHVTLVDVAKAIATEIKADRDRRLTRKEVLDKLVAGAKNNKVDVSSLNDKVRGHIQEALNK